MLKVNGWYLIKNKVIVVYFNLVFIINKNYIYNYLFLFLKVIVN